jgi:hypothetical protein
VDEESKYVHALADGDIERSGSGRVGRNGINGQTRPDRTMFGNSIAIGMRRPTARTRTRSMS